jgi:hypothetical protein
VGTRRDRFASPSNLACFAGIAPVKEARQSEVDPLALGPSQVQSPDLSRMSWLLDPNVWVGTEHCDKQRYRQGPPCSYPLGRLQMDPHLLPLLA